MKNKKRKVLEELKRYVRGYFSETTVHGFRYIIEGRNIYERIAWAIFVVLGFAWSLYIILSAFESWEKHPVQITVDEVSVPVQELPFPAITVCDTESLQMPRRNRWMFLEKLLNAAQLKDPENLLNMRNPGNESLR